MCESGSIDPSPENSKDLHFKEGRGIDPNPDLASSSVG